MATATATKSKTTTSPNSTIAKVGTFLGSMYSLNVSLKLYHWHVTGRGSYAEHIALDQALEDLTEILDRLVETSYALYGDIKIVVPETPVPADIRARVKKFFQHVEDHRGIFKESFSGAILDDYQEALQQLMYRLLRLQ